LKILTTPYEEQRQAAEGTLEPAQTSVVVDEAGVGQVATLLIIDADLCKQNNSPDQNSSCV